METLLLAALVSWFMALRLRTYLLFFQQEDYSSARLLRWWREARAYDRWASLGLAVMIPFGWLQPAAVSLMAGLWLLWRGHKEPDVTQVGKKPLALTVRATQLWLVAGGGMALGGAAWAVWQPAVAWVKLPVLIGLIQLTPLALVLAKLLLSPLTARRHATYLREAKELVARLQPKVVAISGAYGKTSTKYFLDQILSVRAPTLRPAGSINTPLGLARVIREHLTPAHQYLLAEMGTYQEGSIRTLCTLFPPDAACTTAVGPAHLERFGEVAKVAEAEFELIEATLARGGPVVLNIDGIAAEFWRPKVEAAPQIRLVGSRREDLRPGDYLLKLATPTPHGLQLAIEHKGQLTPFIAPIYGLQMAQNLATAFALATELGVPKELSAAALGQVTGAPHRLQRREQGGMTILDDSYNSNPAGFAAALETLALVGQGRRKILVTPGMVELGPLHAGAHREAGRQAAVAADVVLAVAPQRIPTFLDALRTAQREGSTVVLHPMPTFKAAQAWLAAHGQPGDVVLLENDLPDRYERRWEL